MKSVFISPFSSLEQKASFWSKDFLKEHKNSNIFL